MYKVVVYLQLREQIHSPYPLYPYMYSVFDAVLKTKSGNMRHAVPTRMHPYYRESKRSKGQVVFANSNFTRWLVYVDSLLNTVTPFQLLSGDSHTEADTENLGHLGGRKIREYTEIFHRHNCKVPIFPYSCNKSVYP
jgi:hypothetical protein